MRPAPRLSASLREAFACFATAMTACELGIVAGAEVDGPAANDNTTHSAFEHAGPEHQRGTKNEGHRDRDPRQPYKSSLISDQKVRHTYRPLNPSSCLALQILTNMARTLSFYVCGQAPALFT